MALVIVPNKLRCCAVPETYEREASVGFRRVENLQHTVSGNGIICADAIDGNDCARVVVLGGGGECVDDCSCAGSGRQSKLMRGASVVDVG